jgi:hypothetical protein
MAKFLVIIRGGSMPEDPEEGAKVMQAWNDWFVELGGAILDPGSPISQVRTLASDGSVGSGDGHSVTGYMTIEAGDLDAAMALAKGCPLAGGMTLEIGQAASM